MNTYTLTVDYISNLPILAEWEEARSLVDHAAALRPRDWQLPVRSCLAAGGTQAMAVPACAGLACAQVGILLIDDMLDEDPRGEYRRLGSAQTANFAASLLSAASESILVSRASATIKLGALEGLNHMLTALALGQFLDSQNPADEVSYWRAVRLKSGSFFKAALELGALFGGAGERPVHEIGRIGLLYGEMTQIHDDLADCMVAPAGPDWLQGRTSLPILFASTVGHPERSQFLELRTRASEPEALQAAQQILIRCGAVGYCVDQLMRRSREAASLLSTVRLPHVEEIEHLVEAVVGPVRELLAVASHS